MGTPREKFLKRRLRIMEWKAERREKELHREVSATSSRSDVFYKSYEWQKLRFHVFEIHGRKCQLCGNSPEFGGVLQVDHIKPRWLYPELAFDINNLQVLCRECNTGKALKVRDYRPKVILRKNR